MTEILPLFYGSLHQYQIGNKDQFLHAIANLEYAVGPVDTMKLSSLFIPETTLMLKNAISLFEAGYVDAAYYSMRESIELILTLIYFSEKPKNDRIELLKNWSGKKSFPATSDMIKFCKDNHKNYNQIIRKIPSFPGKLGNTRKKLDKFVHKQGYDTFYLYHHYKRINLPDGDNDSAIIDQFAKDLKECICLIAILSLALDPFPLMLTDDEIYYRVQLLSEPYSDWFIKNYLKEYEVEKIKHTDYYKEIRNEIIANNEKMNEAVYWINNLCPVVIVEKTDELIDQSHLLEDYQKICIALFNMTDKIIRIQSKNDLTPFVRQTDPETLHNSIPIRDIIEKQSNGNHFNTEIKGLYYSSIEIKTEVYYLCHLKPLDDGEKKKIENVYKSEPYISLNKEKHTKNSKQTSNDDRQ